MNPVATLRTATRHGDDEHRWRMLNFWCPGCDAVHQVNLVGPDGYRPNVCWEWDGNLESPTISPSILVRQHIGDQAKVCHSFLRAGRWEFLSDSTHDLAGQTVAMVPVPDWLVRE